MIYLPAFFDESRPEVLQQLINERPLGTLVTLGAAGLSANHIPFEYDSVPSRWGTLRGHVARANPVWHEFSKEIDALVIFHGPSSYISPSWYPTKATTGEVVPTYNYAVVHAYGPLRIIDDPIWLRRLVSGLTSRFEAKMAAPWQISDAPESFIEKQLQAIVGIEMVVSKLVGKWKVSQNRPAIDRAGVVSELSEAPDADGLAIAEMVRERGKN
ncbi:MAG TPA: FMN-binding negative transcriptional regulator [Acidobacteriota bacterium]|nr:FMN-binding negative transcriptional regulator [Acidobacteriota bacterium]